jgi:hypothetical protein
MSSPSPYVWAFPALSEGPGAVKYLVNHWQTEGIYAFRSGDPLTVLSGSSNNSGSYQGRDRALFLGGNVYGGTACGSVAPCKNYLNQAAFAVNPPGTFGNASKGEFIGPQYSDWDVGIVRTFPIYEQANLQFRAEYFDVLNHTNFVDPSTTTGSSLGRITGSNDPRIAQFSLKLAF